MKKELSKYEFSKISKEVLKYWVIKESAYKWQSAKRSSDFSMGMEKDPGFGKS